MADYLANQAYLRTDTVRETGEFAVRGGILDVFPLDKQYLHASISLVIWSRPSAALIQPRNVVGKVDQLILRPVAEFMMNDDTIAQFRTEHLHYSAQKLARMRFMGPFRQGAAVRALNIGCRYSIHIW